MDWNATFDGFKDVLAVASGIDRRQVRFTNEEQPFRKDLALLIRVDSAGSGAQWTDYCRMDVAGQTRLYEVVYSERIFEMTLTVESFAIRGDRLPAVVIAQMDAALSGQTLIDQLLDLGLAIVDFQPSIETDKAVDARAVEASQAFVRVHVAMTPVLDEHAIEVEWINSVEAAGTLESAVDVHPIDIEEGPVVTLPAPQDESERSFCFTIPTTGPGPWAVSFPNGAAMYDTTYVVVCTFESVPFNGPTAHLDVTDQTTSGFSIAARDGFLLRDTVVCFLVRDR